MTDDILSRLEAFQHRARVLASDVAVFKSLIEDEIGREEIYDLIERAADDIQDGSIGLARACTLIDWSEGRC